MACFFSLLYKSYGAFLLVLLWLALTYHPFFPLDFCNDSDLHRDFSFISHGSETVTIFLFHALVSTDEHIIQKIGAFFYHFPAVCILKRDVFSHLFFNQNVFVIDIVFLLFLSAPVLIWCTSDQLPERFTEIRKISIADFHRNFANRKR